MRGSNDHAWDRKILKLLRPPLRAAAPPTNGSAVARRTSIHTVLQNINGTPSPLRGEGGDGGEKIACHGNSHPHPAPAEGGTGSVGLPMDVTPQRDAKRRISACYCAPSRSHPVNGSLLHAPAHLPRQGGGNQFL